MIVKFKVYRVVPLALLSCVLPVVSFALNADPVGSGPGPGIRYATDAYPGFDDDESFLNPKRKEPRWFSWFFGPKCDSPQSQMAHCRALESEAEWTKAVREYDALVRQWPNSKEAVFAQRSLADILSGKLGEMQKAYEEYRYLADFYSLDCDYESVVDEMYKIAGVMRIEGKTIVFFRFRNTVDVRRAFEGCVLRAPGAKWAAQAMLQIGELREEDARYSEAVKVYENLRNIHYGSPEAKQALVKEASARMQIIRQYGYNRERCQDTVSFLKLALERAALPQKWQSVTATSVISLWSVFRTASFSPQRELKIWKAVRPIISSLSWIPLTTSRKSFRPRALTRYFLTSLTPGQRRATQSADLPTDAISRYI